MSESISNKPIQVFRRRGIKVSVFQNPSGDQVFHKVVTQKIYKEGEDWKTTNSLGRDDLPIAQMLLGRAWEFILDLECNPQGSKSENRQEQLSVEND